MGAAGLPAQTVFAATSRVTTAPAPTTQLSPMETPGRMMAFLPTKTLFPRVTGFVSGRSKPKREKSWVRMTAPRDRQQLSPIRISRGAMLSRFASGV